MQDLNKKVIQELTGRSRTSLYRWELKPPKKYLTFCKVLQKCLDKGFIIDDIKNAPLPTTNDVELFFKGQGIGRVSKILGYNPASLWRYTCRSEQHKVPVIVLSIIKMISILDNTP